MARDFLGYGGKYPGVRWPNGAHLAVCLALVLEEGTEAGEAWRESADEYGTRAGWWRISRTVDSFGVPLTVSACARALEESPWLGAAAHRRGYQLECRGYDATPLDRLDEDGERGVIEQSLRVVERLAGTKPAGWRTPTGASGRTRRLVAQAGFAYDGDACNDDAPYLVAVDGRAHLVVPSADDTSDHRFADGSAFVRGRDFADYCVDAFEQLWGEGSDAPRMLPIEVRARVIGRPARIGGLASLLLHMKDKGKVWFATREQVARHWLQSAPLP